MSNAMPSTINIPTDATMPPINVQPANYPPPVNILPPGTLPPTNLPLPPRMLPPAHLLPPGTLPPPNLPPPSTVFPPNPMMPMTMPPQSMDPQGISPRFPPHMVGGPPRMHMPGFGGPPGEISFRFILRFIYIYSRSVHYLECVIFLGMSSPPRPITSSAPLTEEQFYRAKRELIHEECRTRHVDPMAIFQQELEMKSRRDRERGVHPPLSRPSSGSPNRFNDPLQKPAPMLPEKNNDRSPHRRRSLTPSHETTRSPHQYSPRTPLQQSASHSRSITPSRVLQGSKPGSQSKSWSRSPQRLDRLVPSDKIFP